MGSESSPGAEKMTSLELSPKEKGETPTLHVVKTYLPFSGRQKNLGEAHRQQVSFKRPCS